MQAVVLSAIEQLAVATVADPRPAAGEVVVRLHAAALNHRDVWIKQGQYAGLKFPCIPGSDGAGVIEAAGEGVEADMVGLGVVINPAFGWGKDPRAQGHDFSILGLPRDGTLAERVAVPAAQLAPKPEHLTWEEAAALPLAALTAWRAVMTRAALQPGERVLVSGAGGGVALMAVQFAVAHGAEVWVTSGHADKIARAVKLGAKGGFDYTKPAWGRVAVKEAGCFDVIVESAGGEGFAELLDVAAPGGRIVFYGATRGDPPSLPMRKVFWRQLSLLGTTMGSPADWEAMLAFVARHELRPVVNHVFPLAQAAEAFALMEGAAQFGKIVLKL